MFYRVLNKPLRINPYAAGNYMFKVNSRNIRTRYENWRRSGVFIVNFEHISLLKKAVLKDFAKFTGKHLCQSLFFIIKKCLSVNFVKLLRAPSVRLLLFWVILIIRKCWLTFNYLLSIRTFFSRPLNQEEARLFPSYLFLI